jgi:hypothetical protein
VSGSATEGVCCAVAGGVCCAAGGCVPWVGGGSRGHLFSKFPCCAPAATTSGPAVIAIKAATQFRNVIFSTHAVQTYARLEKRPYWDRWGMTRCLARGRAGCSILGEREAERPEATPRQRPLGLSRATFYMESSRTARLRLVPGRKWPRFSFGWRRLLVGGCGFSNGGRRPFVGLPPFPFSKVSASSRPTDLPLPRPLGRRLTDGLLDRGFPASSGHSGRPWFQAPKALVGAPV